MSTKTNPDTCDIPRCQWQTEFVYLGYQLCLKHWFELAEATDQDIAEANPETGEAWLKRKRARRTG